MFVDIHVVVPSALVLGCVREFMVTRVHETQVCVCYYHPWLHKFLKHKFDIRQHPDNFSSHSFDINAWTTQNEWHVEVTLTTWTNIRLYIFYLYVPSITNACGNMRHISYEYGWTRNILDYLNKFFDNADCYYASQVQQVSVKVWWEVGLSVGLNQLWISNLWWFWIKIT